MSYEKAMKWHKKHPKGTRQPVLMFTNSGFWPSGSYLEEHYWPYMDRCQAAGTKPMSAKDYYDRMVAARHNWTGLDGHNNPLPGEP